MTQVLSHLTEKAMGRYVAAKEYKGENAQEELSLAFAAVAMIPQLTSTINALRERVEAVEGWVACEERVPEPGRYILFILGRVEPGYRRDLRFHTRKNLSPWEDSHRRVVPESDVTHWRPLPPSPKA